MAAAHAQKVKIESVLSKPRFASIHMLLGAIIRVRLSAQIHAYSLVRLLEEENEQILALWEKPCGLYLRAMKSAADAVAKIALELKGPAETMS